MAASLPASRGRLRPQRYAGVVRAEKLGAAGLTAEYDATVMGSSKAAQARCPEHHSGDLVACGRAEPLVGAIGNSLDCVEAGPEQIRMAKEGVQFTRSLQSRPCFARIM